MRTKYYPACRVVRPWIHATQIPGGVRVHLESQCTHPEFDLPVAIAHRCRQKSPADTWRIFREARQSFAASDHFLCAREMRCRRMAHHSTLAANARLDGSVWLIRRHENMVGIVLPETRQIDQQTMLVGHA